MVCTSNRPVGLFVCFYLKHKMILLHCVHLTLPPHIFSVQVKSRNMLHHGSVWASLKQNKRNLKKPNPNP